MPNSESRKPSSELLKEARSRGWLNAKDQKNIHVSRLLDSSVDSEDIEWCLNAFAAEFAERKIRECAEIALKAETNWAARNEILRKWKLEEK